MTTDKKKSAKKTTTKVVDTVSTADFNQLVEATTIGFKAANEILAAPGGPIFTKLLELEFKHEANIAATAETFGEADEKFEQLTNATEVAFAATDAKFAKVAELQNKQKQTLVALFELIGKRLDRLEAESFGSQEVEEPEPDSSPEQQTVQQINELLKGTGIEVSFESVAV